MTGIPQDIANLRSPKRILSHREHFTIPAGQFAFLLTEEVVHVPDHVLGFISLKAQVKFGGLVNVSGFHVDPGYHGRLVYSVYNAGPAPVELERGKDLFLIWFAHLDNPSTRFVRNKHIIENEHISADLIARIRGELLTLQSLSERLTELRQDFFRMKTYAIAYAAAFSILVALVGLLLSGVKIFGLQLTH
jgi:dCTP deaminase